MNRDKAIRPLEPNQKLIGIEGSRLSLETPCLLLDRQRLKTNLALGADLAREHGMKLRPHLKAHKSAMIAVAQRHKGAIGFCVASVGEACVFAALGFNDLLITSTYATEGKIGRVLSLIDSGSRIISVIDNIDVARSLADQAARGGIVAEVMIDVDMGRARSGCRDLEAARTLADFVSAADGVKLRGVQAYAGHLSHTWGWEDRKTAWLKAEERASDFLSAIQDVCSNELVLSGGSTGSSALDVKSSVLTEVQWGSYALMDVEYLRVEPQGGSWDFAPALTVATSVTSVNAENHVTLDFGHKHVVSRYGSNPVIHRGARKEAEVYPVSDEHAFLMVAPGEIDLGTIVEIVIPHCDPCANLFDQIHVVEGERLTEICPVDARGVF